MPRAVRPAPVPTASPAAIDVDLAADVAASLLGYAGDTRCARVVAALAPHRQSLSPDAWCAAVAARLAIPAPERRAAIRCARETASRALADAARHGIAVIASTAATYPPLLARIVDPPPVLWTKGDVSALSAPAVAVVGARAATPSGLRMAATLGRDLAAAGLVVVSGLARGVDGAAHAAALDAGGRTVGVLGCGLDRVYPAMHTGLAARMIARGAIVSELMPGTLPLPAHFPRRNRIISGLSLAVVVVEASDRSGSLITARMALEQGRDVLAVPGSPASGCYGGSHALIKDGARLVETVKDVLEEIRWSPPRVATADGTDGGGNLTPIERVMACGESYTIEDLAARLGDPAESILAALTLLELDGRVRRLAGGRFVRA
jgi:DNA processing protein